MPKLENKRKRELNNEGQFFRYEYSGEPGPYYVAKGHCRIMGNDHAARLKVLSDLGGHSGRNPCESWVGLCAFLDPFFLRQYSIFYLRHLYRELQFTRCGNNLTLGLLTKLELGEAKRSFC